MLTVVIVAVLVVVAVVVTVTVGSGSHCVVVTVEGRDGVQVGVEVGLWLLVVAVEVLGEEVLLCAVWVSESHRFS